jgi:hypothetical protein
MTLTVCAITSCSSRAIRARSSANAAAVNAPVSAAIMRASPSAC